MRRATAPSKSCATMSVEAPVGQQPGADLLLRRERNVLARALLRRNLSARFRQRPEDPGARPDTGPVRRIDPPPTGAERETLRGFLDYHRATLAAKCAGLTAEQLRRRAAPASELTLLGLVRHLAEVERAWFRKRVNGEHELPGVWSRGDPLVAFDVSAADPDEAFAAWHREVARAREIERAVRSLGTTFHRPGAEIELSLRWLLLHMIEEYARHNGHADLLREAIDGATGE